MAIDFHIHNAQPDELNTTTLIERANLLGVDRLVLLGDVLAHGFHPTTEQVREINDRTIRLVRKFPDRLFGFCFLNPANDPVFNTAEINRCITDEGFKGIKLEASVNCRRPTLDHIMTCAQELSIPILHHCWKKTYGQLEEESLPTDLAALATRFPDVEIIVSHLTGIQKSGILDVAPCPNIRVDTSGGPPVSGLVEYAVAKLGAERLVFGSDAYGSGGRDIACQLGRVLSAAISEKQKVMITRTNAERILKL